MICPNSQYSEAGYTAYDNVDGDLTTEVQTKIEENKVIYTVTDSSGNETRKIRKIIYSDTISPTITLKGIDTVEIVQGEKYTELGYSVSDNCDHDIINNIKIDSNLDINKEGQYTISYQVSDSSGNKGFAVRKINVINKKSRDINSFQSSLEKYIKDNKYNVSIIYYILQNGYTYRYRSKVVYYGASLIKTLDALYVYEKLYDRDDLKPLVEKAITVSDNTAHRQLVDAIGINNLRQYGEYLGAKYCLTKSDTDYYANTNAEDQLLYMKYLWDFINNTEKGKELKLFFINDYYNYLTFDKNIPVMHKYGYY